MTRRRLILVAVVLRLGIVAPAGRPRSTALLARLLFDFQAAAPGWSIALGFLVSSAVGLLAGMWPALKAARQDPIEALRWE